jgi:hypothetical protein
MNIRKFYSSGFGPCSAAITPIKPAYGVLVNGSFTTLQKADIAFDLGVTIARGAVHTKAFEIDDSEGENMINAYSAKGLKVNLNINTGPSPYAFVTAAELDDWAATFEAIVVKYLDDLELVSVLNEEINKSYHTGPLSDYIAMLTRASLICHDKGVLVTNGGIYGSGLEMATYRFLVAEDRQGDADAFGAACMATYQVQNAKIIDRSATAEAAIAEIETLLAAYVSANIDFVNIHYYETQKEGLTTSEIAAQTLISPKVVQFIQEYILSVTGLETITNETGQRKNEQPALVTNMLTEYERLNFPYVLWFSGDGGAETLGARSLVNPDASFRPSGTAFEVKVTA